MNTKCLLAWDGRIQGEREFSRVPCVGEFIQFDSGEQFRQVVAVFWRTEGTIVLHLEFEEEG